MPSYARCGEVCIPALRVPRGLKLTHMRFRCGLSLVNRLPVLRTQALYLQVYDPAVCLTPMVTPHLYLLGAGLAFLKFFVFSAEALDPSGGVYEFLLPGKKRMAF